MIAFDHGWSLTMCLGHLIFFIPSVPNFAVYTSMVIGNWHFLGGSSCTLWCPPIEYGRHHLHWQPQMSYDTAKCLSDQNCPLAQVNPKLSSWNHSVVHNLPSGSHCLREPSLIIRYDTPTHTEAVYLICCWQSCPGLVCPPVIVLCSCYFHIVTETDQNFSVSQFINSGSLVKLK